MKSITCLVKKGDRLDSDLIKFAKEHLTISNEYLLATSKYDDSSSWMNVKDVFNNKADVNERNIKPVRAIILKAERACEKSNKALENLRRRTLTLVA